MKQILVVDDSFVARMMVKKVLSPDQFSVLEASGGAEAMELLEKNRADLVLLDLLMPDENGEHVLQRLKERYPDLPVIILSADIQETTKKRCLSLGAERFVSKPPSPERLLPAIGEILS